MKGLYISIIDIGLNDGYDRKILGQIRAMISYGWTVDIICFRLKSIVLGHVGKEEVDWSELGKKYTNIFFRRIIFFKEILSYVNKNKLDFIFVRYPRVDILFSLFLFLVKLRNHRFRIIYEIPTFPFEHENSAKFVWKDFLLRINDTFFRPFTNLFINSYAVVAYEGRVFNKTSFRIENGVELQKDLFFELKTPIDQELNLVFVANFAANNLRHGLDRLLRGFENYIRNSKDKIKIKLHIVGDISPQKDILGPMIASPTISPFIVVYGRMKYDELKELYKKMHIGIGCLGFHRVGVTHTSALKEREYLMFGIPVVSSSLDYSLLPEFPYRLKVSDDDTDIDFNELIEFARKCYQDDMINKKVIQESYNELNWSKAMIGLKKYMENII